MSEPDPNSYPRLRAVEAFPVQAEGENYVCLQDPQNLAGKPVFLNQALVFLVSRMDGAHSLRDIQADFLRATGEILPLENLEMLVNQLDEQLYLDSQKFQSFYRDLVKRYCDAPSRPAHHAGLAYAADAQLLRAQMGSYFAHPEGPGAEIVANSKRPLRGLVSPHIDFTRGGPTYAHAYSALAGHPGADIFVIFGTCHTCMPNRFSIGSKDYDTPLGPAPVDQDFVARLSGRLDNKYSDEFSHRGEHSIEFQAVWLSYILGGKQPFKIVPILIGSFQDIYLDGRSAEDDPEVQKVTSAIKETMKESPGCFCFLAGADLAHVGSRFGDPSGPTESYLQEVEREDRKLLEFVEKGDAESLFQSIAADNDRRRVCGYPSIYMALRCIENTEGKLLQYRQWADMAAGSAVTYASVALF
jgi:AmmeMemoRadiSam system protein B